ncbi:DUF6807 family protein [Puniceicoccus vermicola]|uniref:PmoA family protein n=1 Tax=Puniceicoccus vermicola TaxID=388746 RepID=A0A7X1AUS3_9BACT|nr:DUF6807 family protein [Puniceicoccus vermicola]MBC2600254.1 PmoA family protein [Puniceicoccus vermicola]
MRGNFGTQNHLDWTEVTSDETGAVLHESLEWKNEHSEPTFREQRSIDARVFPNANCWRLHLRFQIQNVSGKTLRLGTFESEEGLQGSHYTGLFFRLHREFLGKGEWEPVGSFLADGNRGLEKIHGKPAPWMASVGSHDNSDSETTLICCDNPRNPHFPTHWFYRPDMPCIALPFVGESAVILNPEETLDLRYDFIIANGIQDLESAQKLVENCIFPEQTPSA